MIGLTQLIPRAYTLERAHLRWEKRLEKGKKRIATRLLVFTSVVFISNARKTISHLVYYTREVSHAS